MTEIAPSMPVDTGGCGMTRFNALRHGVLSRYTVLPWEDADEYGTLVDSLVSEHEPRGPTEEHLVEELAGVLWRKRRLRLAEAAAYRCSLEDTKSSYSKTVKAALVLHDPEDDSEGTADAIRNSPEQSRIDLADTEEDEAMTGNALRLLRSGKVNAYEAAVAALREDTRESWQDELEVDPNELEVGELPYSADVSGLLRFLEQRILPWYKRRRQEIGKRPLIREQAFGESLDPDRLEPLGRYEVHLDRKLERMLAMLLRLKDLRRGASED